MSQVIQAVHRCEICYDEIKSQEQVICPVCDSSFHRKHLGAWLLTHNTCASCREHLPEAFLKEMEPRTMEEKKELQQMSDEYTRYFPKAGQTGTWSPNVQDMLYVILILFYNYVLYLSAGAYDTFYLGNPAPSGYIDLWEDFLVNENTSILLLFVPFVMVVVLGNVYRIIEKFNKEQKRLKAIIMISLFVLPFSLFSGYTDIMFYSVVMGSIVSFFIAFEIYTHKELEDKRFWWILAVSTFLITLVVPILYLI